MIKEETPEGFVKVIEWALFAKFDQDGSSEFFVKGSAAGKSRDEKERVAGKKFMDEVSNFILSIIEANLKGASGELQ